MLSRADWLAEKCFFAILAACILVAAWVVLEVALQRLLDVP